MLAPGYKAAPTAPIKTGAHGFVKSPITDMLAAIHGTTTVHVHPTKGISVAHVPGLATLPAKTGQKPPTKPLPTTPAAAPPVSPLGDSGVPHDARPNQKPDAAKPVKAKAKPASAATSGGVAAGPGASDAATAKSVIDQILAPVIKQITDSETARAAAGQQAIGGYTTNAENQLKGLDFQSPFNEAAGGENAINTALLARLNGEGSALQNEVQGKIGAIDPALAAQIGTATGATAAGAANAGLAKGDATASELLSEGANAGTYGKKLPGITALAGAQDTGKLQGQVAADQKSQLDSITAKLPQMVQDELATLTSARTAAEKNRIAVALAENIDPNTGQLNAKGRAELQRLVIDQQRTNISQQNANTSAVRANNSQANADRNYKLAKERVGLSETKLKIAYDKAQTELKQKGKLHGLTQNEYQTKQSQALGLARIAHAPTADGHPPVSWQQYLNGGLRAKVPIWILIEQGKRVYSQDEIHKGLIPGG